MKVHIMALIAAVSACSAPPKLEVSGQAALGQIGYAGPVLDQAQRDFMGGGGFPGFGGNEPVPYGGAAAATLAVAALRSDPLTPGLNLQSRAYAELGATTARLPQGLGVFTDPARVRMLATGLGADVMLERTRITPGGQRMTYAVGLGVTRTLAWVDVQSALIDRQSRVWLTQPYLSLATRTQRRSGLDLAADLRVFSGGGAELRLGVAQGW
jgi:hypothetical protein